MVVWTETRLKIVKQFLQTESLTHYEIAELLGFQNPKNLQGHLNALLRQKYLISDLSGALSMQTFRLNHDIRIVIQLYRDNHYRSMKFEIRELPFVLDVLLKDYSVLSSELIEIIRIMMACSDTFFEIILENKTPELLIHTYRHLMYPFRLTYEYQGEIQQIILIHELYSFSLVRDMKSNNLADGFYEPLKSVRHLIKGYSHGE